MLYSKSELSRILAAMNEEIGATELLEVVVKYLDQDVLEDMVRYIDEEVFSDRFFDVTQPEEGEIPFFMESEEDYNYYDDDEDYIHPTWYEKDDYSGEDY